VFDHTVLEGGEPVLTEKDSEPVAQKVTDLIERPVSTVLAALT
jgi:hypothetical protein